MEKKIDWYSYLAGEFKLARDAYTVSDRAVFECPKCLTTRVVRINHVKDKIKKLGHYECSVCRKRASMDRAKSAYYRKYGEVNPFELESVKKKIKNTNQERYGVDCILETSARDKGVAKIKEQRAKRRGFEYPDFSYLPAAKRPAAYDKYRNRFDRKYNLRKRLYSFINRSLKLNSSCGSSKTTLAKTLGYTHDELVASLESKFLPGMTWENRSEWHIDHIIPLSKFDLSTDGNIKKANALSNLQPLWKRDNIKKRDKLPTVILLSGCFGVGKTTLCSKLNVPIFSHDMSHDEISVAKTVAPVVIFETGIQVRRYVKRFREYFKVKFVVLTESEEIIVSRIISRGGSPNIETVKTRLLRMKSLAKDADFCGNADECFRYINTLIKQFG